MLQVNIKNTLVKFTSYVRPTSQKSDDATANRAERRKQTT
jgi:hypothetical protein